MDFERYKVPKSVSEGVEIELPGTKQAAFLVALPSDHNRAFTAAKQRALMAGGAVTLGEDGKPDFSKVDFIAFRDAQLEAFLAHCILKFPEGITPEGLRGDYHPGLVALFDKAVDMASDEEKAGAAATKKLRA